MALRIYYLLLPALAYGRMAVFINITHGSEPLADVIGHFTNIISDAERETFQIEDKELAAAVASYSGQAPFAVYVNNAALYESHNWFELKRTARPNLKINISEAKCGKPQMFNSKTGAIAITWGGAKISVAENSEYEISVMDFNFKFNSSWGEIIKRTNQNYGDTFAKMCNLTVDIGYVAKLSGDVAVDFGKKYKDRYHWAFDINKVQEKAGLPKTVEIKQTIKISYTHEV